MSDRRTAAPLPGTILLVVGFLLVAITVFVERRQEKIFGGALHTTGTVVAMIPQHGTRGSVTYAPIVRYRTNTGVQFDFTSSAASNPPPYKLGEAVPVVYPPLNPAQADIWSWSTRWLETVLCGSLALASVVLGGVILIRRRM